MNRHVLTLELRDAPGVVASYREYHAHVWPEVVASLTTAGVRRLDIYLLDRRLVMILDLEEGLDLAGVFARHASSGAKVTEWEQLMKSLQQPAPGAHEGEWWAAMEQVFELTAFTGAARPPANPADISLLSPEPRMTSLRQAWNLPTHPRPIVVVGTGAIVRTAHLPAYKRLGFPVAGLFDIRRDTAIQLASDFDIPRVFDTLDAALSAGRMNAVFDLAVPGGDVLAVLRRLPEGSPVLIQKPMGESLDAARAILKTCQDRRLTAAINFQLRFSPNVLAVQDLIRQGTLGEVADIEVRLQVRQPWETWSFVRNAPRLELLYHSIHYLDTIRMLVGEPSGVYCRAVAHPEYPDFSDTRSSIILDYGNRLRCSLTLNHTHRYDGTHRTSMLKLEGTAGAALLSLGVNLNYPSGPPDTLEVASDNGWQPVPLRGSWFNEAFEGPMSNLQRFVAGEDKTLVSPVEDAIKTMALVEACYQSSEAGGTPVPRV